MLLNLRLFFFFRINMSWVHRHNISTLC